MVGGTPWGGPSGEVTFRRFVPSWRSEARLFINRAPSWQLSWREQAIRSTFGNIFLHFVRCHVIAFLNPAVLLRLDGLAAMVSKRNPKSETNFLGLGAACLPRARFACLVVMRLFVSLAIAQVENRAFHAEGDVSDGIEVSGQVCDEALLGVAAGLNLLRRRF